MLEGKLVVKHEKLGEVDYQVKARDTFNDLKLHITAHGDGGYTLWNNRRILFDYVLNEETGDYFSPYVDEPGSDIRRLDIKKTNKYKSNITNKDLAIKISSLVRYMQINGKKNYNQKNMGDNFSSIREVDVYDSEGKVYIGTVKYRMGLITELFCENKFLRLELKSGELGLLDETIFKELKEKDKWGNKISPAPISIVGFKLDEEFLGFKYVPPVSKEVVQAFGIYETIEDVISAHPEKNTRWILDRDYHIVTDANLEEVIQMFMDHDGLIAFDTETSGLNINFKSRTNEADQLVGVVLSRKPGEGYYFPLQHKLFPNLCDGDHHYFMERYMRPILEGKRIICHNLKFDWKVAYIYDINANIVYDTMLAVGVTKRYEEETFEMSLAALAKNIFGLDMFELSDFVMGGSFGDSDIAFWDLPYELVRQYAPADTDITISLYEFFEQEDLLNKYNAKRIFDMEITFAKAVAYSEFYGYHVDVDRIPDLRERIVGAMEECKAKMFEIAGKEFNPNSPQQLASIMYDELGIEMIGNKRSTSKEILKALSYKTDAEGNPKYPFVKYLKEYRDNESIYKNFLKRLHEFSTDDGYIFPDVLQLGTNTGRTSVKNPNYQSYNDTVKKYITPRPGFIHVDSDFAQIEYRVLASMAGQEQLIDAFNDPDLDYHSYQASRMFSVPYAAVTKQLRQQSKGVNFGLPYGMGDESLGAAIFGERSPENTIQARKLREKFFQGQEKIQNFFETARANGVRNGFTETDFGRRRYYHKGVFSVNEIRRQAGNHVIQGTAADIYKLAVVQMFKRIVAEGWLGKVLLNAFVHDELLMEVHESINLYYFTKVWREEFEVKIQGYCRLFAGLGYGFCWYDAKGLDLPPLYIDEIEKAYEEDMEWDEDLESFLEDIKNNYELHKTNRIKKYILSEENKGEVIKPAIGSLLSEEIGKLIPKIQGMGNVDSYNAILTKSEIPLEGKGSVSYLQDQLKIFCKYYDIDYNSIDVKSPDEIVIQTEESTNTDNDFEDFYSDEVSPEVKKSMIELTLRMNGIYTDIEEKTVYMLEMWCYQNSQFQQATKILIDKGLITTDGDFKIIYYPTLNTANPQCAEIPNYFIPKDNISIIAQYYAVWRQQAIGVFK